MSQVDDKRQDRVILRVNPTFYSAISELASSENRSVNSEICTAVDKWLYERDSMILVKDRLLASASAETIIMIRKATPAYLITPVAEGDTCKVPVRFKESVNSDLRAAWARYKAEATRFISLNTFLKIVVSWWLSYQYQLSACVKAIHQDFKNNVRPSRAALIDSAPQCGSLALA